MQRNLDPICRRGCGGEVLKGTWPIPCFTLEVTEAGEEGKKKKVWCAKTTQYQYTWSAYIEKHRTFLKGCLEADQMWTSPCLLWIRILFGQIELREVSEGGVEKDGLRPSFHNLASAWSSITIHDFQVSCNQVMINPAQVQRHPPQQQ